MRRAALMAFGVLLGLALSGCGPAAAPSAATQTSTSIPPPAPAHPAAAPAPGYAALPGQAKNVTESTGATATITLNGVRYAHTHPGDSLDPGEAVVDLTITATSATPFDYSEDDVVFAYGSSYAKLSGPNMWGGDPTFDFTPYLPPNPIRNGQLSQGQTLRGLVALQMGSLGSKYQLAVTDPKTVDTLAEWLLTSPR